MRSMTGIGHFRLTEGEYDLIVSIRSVNHRFLQLYIRLPSCFTSLESRIRRRICRDAVRGKIDIAFDFLAYPSDLRTVYVNRAVAASYIENIKALSAAFDLPSGMDAEKMMHVPEILTHILDEAKLEETWKVLEKALEGALSRFNQARQEEGCHLKNDFTRYGEDLSKYLQRIHQIQDQQLKSISARLHSNLEKLSPGIDFDPNRLEQEIALAAIKSDISEEITRLGGHLKRYNQLLESKSPQGKELEFVAQELHREINTIGAKSNDAELSSTVIDVKLMIEKIREQIQNIE